MGKTIEKAISHKWKEETTDEKTRWFKTLPLSERMDMLCYFTDMVLNVNPEIVELKKYAQPTLRRVRIVSKE